VTSDLVDIFLLSLVAMFNPTLLAAVTVMLLLPNPRRLMVGYLLGAYVAAIGPGLLLVFVLPHSSATSTAKRTLDPVEDLVLGGVALALALALRVRGRPSVQRRRRASKEAKLRARREAGKPTESMPMRMLGKGDPRLTFVVGVLLSFPGVAYLDALDHIHHLDPGIVATVLLVTYFCVAQQILIELPLLGFLFAPERTRAAVAGFRS